MIPDITRMVKTAKKQYAKKVPMKCVNRTSSDNMCK